MAVAVAALAIAGACVVLLSSVGLYAMRDALDKLHYLGPVTTVAPVLVAAAIVLEDGFTSQAGLKATCVAALAIATSPFVQYVVLRAIATRRYGSPVAPVEPELQT